MDFVYNLLQPHLSHIPQVFTTPGCVFAMLLLVFPGTKFLMMVLSICLLNKYDNVQASYKQLTGSVVGAHNPYDVWAKRMVQRAYNAHMNTFEAFCHFSIAVLLCLHTKVSHCCCSRWRRQ